MLKSHPVRLSVANTHQFALRRFDDPVHYTRVTGEIHDTATAQDKYARDLKFRAVGEPLACSPGRKELHLGVKGNIGYNVTQAFLKLAGDNATNPYPADELARISRYHRLMVDLDVELWALADHTPMPVRSEGPSSIDSDWSPNAPLSRVSLTNVFELYSTPEEADGFGGTLGSIAFALGLRKSGLESFVATPVVQIDTLAPYVVPVVTMHIGGRTMAAEDIRAALELQGKVFYL